MGLFRARIVTYDESMHTKPKAVVFWSSGKDSALALERVLAQRTLEVVALVTTLHDRRVAMHEVPESLLEQQAENLALPLVKIPLPWPCPNPVYESALQAALAPFREKGATHAVFGDLFLTDIRAYRESLMDRLGWVPVFPLWQEDTARLAERLIRSGYEAIVVCVDLGRLGAERAGALYDEEFLRDLPAGVDPCGENGEFHTFVRQCPLFKAPIATAVTGTYQQGAFAYASLTEA